MQQNTSDETSNARYIASIISDEDRFYASDSEVMENNYHYANGHGSNRASDPVIQRPHSAKPVTSQFAMPPQGKQMAYEETLELYRQNAKKSNDPYTQLEFAKYLIQIAESIQIVDKQSKKARDSLMSEGIKWVKKLSSTGLGLGKPAYAEAQFFLAECHGNGLFGLEIDHDRAFSLYVQASKQNHAAATYRAAVCYEIGAGPKKDYARAVQFYRKAAALGDIDAMYKLAMILLNGSMNTMKNEREGVTWLKRAAQAADENHPEALHELAVVYEKGGIASAIIDEKYARELYTKAAQLGYAPSQFKLGYCYEYGTLTCEVDPKRSIAWYTAAAQHGNAEAQLALSGWLLTGSEGILEQNDHEAYTWAARAAEKGFAKAEYALGYYNEVGVGTQPNLEEAVKWYTKASAQGNARAKQRLAEIKKYNKMQKRTKMNRDGSNGGGDCVIM
jgi:TPR repeat protein